MRERTPRDIVSNAHALSESTLKDLDDLAKRLQAENEKLENSLLNRFYRFIGDRAAKAKSKSKSKD